MVTPDVYRATESVGEMFEDRDYKAIAVGGAMAALGFGIAATVGAVVNDMLNTRPGDRLRRNAALALGGAVAGGLGVGLLGPRKGGPLAVGSLVFIGAVVLDTLLGHVVDDPTQEGKFRVFDLDAVVEARQGRRSFPDDAAREMPPPGSRDKYRDSGPHRPVVSPGYR